AGYSVPNPRASPLMRSTARSTGHQLRCGRWCNPPATERAEPVSAVLRPILAPQEVGAELVEARAADLAHDEIDFAAEDVDHLIDARNSADNGAVKRRAAEEHELGAEAERDQDVGTAPDPTVEHHRHLIAHRRLDRRQSLERSRGPVELAAAMVGYDDAVDPDLGGANRVGRVENAFDDERARKQAPVALEVAPGLRRGRGLTAAESDDVR